VADADSYHHGNLRRALMDAALALFAERGTLDFTVRELARAAGVTHNAPYRHFADKTAILAALAKEGFAMLAEESERACAPLRARKGPHDARARIEALGTAYVRFAVAHPTHFRLMFTHPLADAKRSDPTLAEAARASFAALHDAVADAAGEVRSGLAVRDVTLAAWALVHGLATLLVNGQLPGEEARLADHTNRLARIFFDGALTPRPARRRPPRG
jgi:AcrR family transcriptional regulator